MLTRTEQGKEYVFCSWRKKWVRLTPEEWVRQHFLEKLIQEYHYPHELMGVEIQLKNKRTDAVVYSPQHNRLIMLLEFKADNVALTQETLDQIVVYNRQCCVPYLILSNGKQTIVAHVLENKINYMPNIPEWKELLN